ncbi:ABC transporter permease [Micromonospora sp. NPDC049679]|uniref:ABC transporter permease n=1 Tax=Micromonospora sp. NPDC049679 TaxID=3155920 RepID=UPI0033C66407
MRPGNRPETEIRPGRVGARDLVAEALAGILQRPGRSLLTSLGTVLGIAAFVVVLGVTATASIQINSRFNTVTATEVMVEAAGSPDADVLRDPFPIDAEARLARVNGVTGGGVYWTVPQRGQAVPAASVDANAAGEQIPIVAASPGLVAAVNPHLASGRVFDDFHNRTGARVAVVGSAIATRLGVGSLDSHPAVFINGIAYPVIGVLDRVERLPDLMLSVTIPVGSVRAIAPTPTGDERPKMLVTTRVGAARQVADELPVALRPDAPDALRAVPPPDPGSLRGPVSTDLAALFLLLAGVCLIIGAVSIANTTLVAVLERVPEIGLRRVVGARGLHITSQFLTESAVLGALGGLFGCSLGVVTVVAVAAWRDWTPVIEPWTVVVAPVIGIAAGLAGGAYPAIRAGRIEPVEALRR